MTISKITVKFLGKKESMFRVLDKAGEVLQVFCTQAEAQKWLDEQ